MNADLMPPHVRSARRPMRVRFFREADTAALEDTINQWLEERVDREIVEVRQTVVAGDDAPGREGPELIVSVWYVEG